MFAGRRFLSATLSEWAINALVAKPADDADSLQSLTQRERMLVQLASVWGPALGWAGRLDLEFVGFGRPVKLRAEDNQGLEAQLVGVTKQADGFNHMVLDNMMIFDAAKITAPAGQKSVEWLKTLKPDFAKMDVPVFQHGK